MVEIGVDIGGTFVDVVCLRDKQELTHTKVPTAPRDLARGVREGIERVLRFAGVTSGEVARVVHGTTVATNAIIERRARPVGILMTEGFEDTLEIGRQKRSRMYDLFLDPETPTFLSPRRMRRGIPERIDPTGQILTPLDEAAVLRAAQEVFQKYGVRAFAVCYLFSFRNPIHERRTEELLLEFDPSLRVSLSSEVDPTFREYERLCVTAFDAYLKPVVGTYLLDLEHSLKKMGIGRPLQVMQSRGAITTSQNAVDRPVLMFLSGPAAGVLGGLHAAEQSGFTDVITMDMGGTSNDVSLVSAGKPLISSETTIAGYPVRIPMVDVSTIGAGGGSIAWIDAGGTLKVGPRSAGAEPGPVCYGRGGTQPTVTDAAVVLGYLPAHLAGGALQLDPRLAHDAIAGLGEQLGLDPVATAAGIFRIVNANMSEQVRLTSVTRGYDPRRFALVLLGGAGPVHGAAVARCLGIGTLLVPPHPGVLSALGLLVANVEHHHAKSAPSRASDADSGALFAIFDELERRGRDLMRREEVSETSVSAARSVDLRYVGQSYELEIPFEGDVDRAGIDRVVARFHQRHREVYGYANPEEPVEILTLRVTHTSAMPRPKPNSPSPRGSVKAARKEVRPAWWPEAGWVETVVYERAELPVGEVLRGPVILEQTDTTVVVPSDHTCVMEANGNLLIRVPVEEGDQARASDEP